MIHHAPKTNTMFGAIEKSGAKLQKNKDKNSISHIKHPRMDTAKLLAKKSWFLRNSNTNVLIA